MDWTNKAIIAGVVGVCIGGGVGAGGYAVVENVRNNTVRVEHSVKNVDDGSKAHLASIDRAISAMDARERQSLREMYEAKLKSKERKCQFYKGMPKVEAKLGCHSL